MLHYKHLNKNYFTFNKVLPQIFKNNWRRILRVFQIPGIHRHVLTSGHISIKLSFKHKTAYSLRTLKELKEKNNYKPENDVLERLAKKCGGQRYLTDVKFRICVNFLESFEIW